MNQLRAGAVLSYLQIIISIIIALVYTPIMIRILGQSEFGLYSLIGSLAAYFSVMDLGLGNAIVRYVSRNRSIGDKTKETNLNGFFLILYSLIGIITLIIGFLIYINIERVFSNLTVTEINKAEIMVIILAINFALAFPLSIFVSIIRAYERFIIEKMITITRIILGPMIILPVIYMGYGAISMVAITTIVNIGTLLFGVMYSIRKLNVRFSFNRIEKGLFKEILGYSFFVFLGIIIDQIYWQTDQIILGIVRGTVPVAVYAIAMQFIRLYIQFSSSISNLLLPRASRLVAENADNSVLTDLMIKFGRVQYLILFYVLGGFILIGQPFINLWAGQGYEDVFYIVLIVMIPLSIPLIQNTGIAILYAKNKQGFRAVTLLFIAILNVVISIPLAKSIGGIGVAIATAISLMIGHIIIMNFYYYKKIGLNIPLFWRNILKMSIPMILALIMGLFVNQIISFNSILFMIIKAIIHSIIYGFTAWIFVLNRNEKNIFYSIKKRLLS